MKKFKIVYYLNQFFGQYGGEDKAGMKPELKEGVIGPSEQVNNALGEMAEVTHTIICGDTYFGENMDEAAEWIKNTLKELNPDLVVAGPAFNAGRYGVACGAVGKAASDLGIDAITGMYPENPGMEMYKKYSYMIETANNAGGMRKALPAFVKLIKTYIEKEGKLGSPAEEGYVVRGIRKNVFAEKRGAERAVEMLVKKIKGEKFETEYPMPAFDRVEPAKAIADISKVRLALVTSGGVVPKGNPDKVESSSASKFGKYDISNLDAFTADNAETAHGGYDPTCCNENPNRVLPLDVVRDLLREKKIGSLHDYFYATVGNGTSVANAKKYAAAIAKDLLADGVEAVILTST